MAAVSCLFYGDEATPTSTNFLATESGWYEVIIIGNEVSSGLYDRIEIARVRIVGDIGVHFKFAWRTLSKAFVGFRARDNVVRDVRGYLKVLGWIDRRDRRKRSREYFRGKL